MPKLTNEQAAEIMRRFHDQLTEEYRRRDAIERGKITPPPPTSTWQISDRH